MTEEKLSFIEHLTLEILACLDETWLTSDAIAEIVNDAAHAVAGDASIEMTITKMVSPDGLRVMHFLFIGPSKDDWFLLYPDDLAYLRAMLCNYDESSPAQIGDALTVSTRDELGHITTKITQEMLNLTNNQDHI